MNMACYILNRLPRAALDGKVAEEVWTRKEVDYSLMRIFGCPTYVHIPIEERSKLDSKSKKCIFLEFKKGVKGHKLWDPVAQKVVISRDVVFDKKSMIEAFRKEEESQEKGSSSDSNKSVMQVELDEMESQLENEPHNSDQEDHNMISKRPKHNIRPLVRYGFEDLASYYLVINSGDPSTFQEAIDSSKRDKWMEAMVEEMESLNKNKT